MTYQKIPLQFAKSMSNLTWPDLSWAYERSIVDWKDLILFAKERLSEPNCGEFDSKIASITKDNLWRLRDLLDSLSKIDGPTEELIKKKWLYITLAWVFENREQSSEPLLIVSEIYEDFDYPNEMVPFVNYMPSDDGYDPRQHSASENKDRLMSKWEKYLKNKSTLYKYQVNT